MLKKVVYKKLQEKY